MRSVRALLTAAALGAMALLGGTACAAASAANASGVWVQVNPSTVQAGSTVTVRASCGDDTNPATISSRAFASTTVQPVDGILSTAVLVAADTTGGTFDVNLVCRTGSKATATLTVLNSEAAAPVSRQSIGPHTGGGFLANGGGGMTSGPFIWIAVGFGSMLAAVVFGVRNKRRAARAVRRW
jgi:hypothetical protein